MSNISGPKILIADAFGVLVDVGQVVVYAGIDYKRRPTLNKGIVEEIAPGKVLVVREWQSARNHLDATRRRVWVESWKVAGVMPFPAAEAA